MTTQAKSEFEFLEAPQRPGDLGRLGHYDVVGSLGKGGMGQVFRAEDSRLKREVALKVMNAKFAATANSRERFLEEARTMAAIHHDNVATIFEVGEQGKTPYMAMELLRGGTLSETFRSGKEFDIGEVIDLGRQVAQGLVAVHSAGIVHRDVKPANIWMEQPSGRAKLLDFGLALGGMRLDQLTSTGAVLGTPGYLSPEQARNEALDDRSDLYSLGVVLYEICSGALPLRSTTLVGQLIAIIAHQPQPLMERSPKVPAPLAELVHQLLEKEPRDRISSAASLVERLEEVAVRCDAERQQAVPKVMVTEPAASRVQGRKDSTASRRPRMTWTWIAATLALVVIPAIAMWVAGTPDGVRHEVSSTDVAQKNPPAPVLAASLRPLQLTDVVGSAGGIERGNAARYRVSVTNTAVDAGSDPKRLNANAEVATQVVCYLEPPGQVRRRAPAFPKRLTPRQLPSPGETVAVELQIMTNTMALGPTRVVFELQSPAGGKVSSIASSLEVAENLREGELIGFKKMRTHAGGGADTYVRRGGNKNFGLQPFVQVHRRGKQVLEHAYLRFDLSKAPFPMERLDRAALMLTFQDANSPPGSTLNAYGVPPQKQRDWSEGKPKALHFSNSPSRDGVGALTYLGQTQASPTKGKQTTDGVRIVGQNLDDYLRQIGSGQAVIVLVRESSGNKPTRFRSKEGKPGEAPALALRPQPTEASDD